MKMRTWKIKKTIKAFLIGGPVRSSVFFGLLFLLYFAVYPPWVPAAPGDSPFSWESGLDIFFDDNILRYSDQDLQNPKKADVIYEPYLLIQYKQYLGKYPLRLFGDITADFYQDNSYKNYETYRVGLKQGLPKKSELLLSASWIPRFNISETHHLRYTSFSLEERTQIARGLIVGLTGRWGQKDDERNPYDTDFWEAGLQGSYRWHMLRIGGGYHFEEGEAAGDPNVDPSYREHSYHLIATLDPRRATRLSFKMARALRDFTTPFPAETIRYGRTDTYQTYRLRLSQDLGKKIEGKIGYERINRDVSGISETDKQLLEYGENIYQVGLGVYW